MAQYELFDGSGSSGISVFGLFGVDDNFRHEADTDGRPDQILLDVTDPADVLAPARIVEASRPLGSVGLNGLADADRQSFTSAA
jgi:hypothetical protein